MSLAMSDLIKQYIQDRANARLEKLDKETEKQRKDAATSPLTLAEVETNYATKRAEILTQFAPAAWLSDAASRAKQLSFATHPAKFTHTDAKGASSVFAASGDQDQTRYLCTASLAAPMVDVAGNAAALDVAQLLQLELDGMSLAMLVKQNDMSAFQDFAEDAQQLQKWQQDFSLAFADRDIRSHSLLKQIYFPLPDGSYHLLGPLFSSSLAQEVYQRVNDSRYPDAAKENRKLRKEGKFSPLPTVDYWQVAVQKFGGTKPQNVSQGNSRRGGKAYLFSCQPPIWQERKLPLFHHKQAFWRTYEKRYDYAAKNLARQMKNFLSKHLDEDSNLRLRAQRAAMVAELIDTLLQFVAELHAMHEHAGWSAHCKLSRAEQLWLDPYREDAQFQLERARKDWHLTVSEQFANWLNHQLQSKDMNMKDSEFREWSRCLQQELAREVLEFDVPGMLAQEATAQVAA